MHPRCRTLVAKTGRPIPAEIREAGGLSDYAAQARYPGVAEPVAEDEYLEAVRLAEQVLRWVEGALGMPPG